MCPHPSGQPHVERWGKKRLAERASRWSGQANLTAIFFPSIEVALRNRVAPRSQTTRIYSNALSKRSRSAGVADAMPLHPATPGPRQVVPLLSVQRRPALFSEDRISGRE